MEKKYVFLQLFNIPKRIVVSLSMLEGLLSLLFYCESGINRYAEPKTLTDAFGGKSVLILEIACLRYGVVPYHLRMLLRVL